ncbi:MAG: hypothetical protein NDI73_00040 [Desulfuromonadales bacterium]|nr:hypothetical protein [Desulfuromonadales bacterium]
MKSKRVWIGAGLLLIAAALLLVPGVSDTLAAVDYQSLIASTDFDVAKADVRTTASGILGIAFTLMVIGLILAVIFR